MKFYIPLKDIILGPGKRFDASVNSEAEVIGFIKKAYGIIASTMEVSITDGVVCIVLRMRHRQELRKHCKISPKRLARRKMAISRMP